MVLVVVVVVSVVVVAAVVMVTRRECMATVMGREGMAASVACVLLLRMPCW